MAETGYQRNHRLISQEFGTTSVFHTIARCESQYKQYNPNGGVLTSHTNDVGIMQISRHYWEKEALSRGINIETPEGNVKMAKIIYQKQGIGAWKASSKCWNKELALMGG